MHMATCRNCNHPRCSPTPPHFHLHDVKYRDVSDSSGYRRGLTCLRAHQSMLGGQSATAGPAKQGRHPWQASYARQKQERHGERAVAHLGENHMSGSALASHSGRQTALLGRYYRSGTLAQRFTPGCPLRSSSRENAARMGTASREQGFPRVTRVSVGQSVWASLTWG